MRSNILVLTMLCFLLSINHIDAATNIKAFCPAPIVTNFSPSTGPENTLITITGSNFLDVALVQMEGEDLTFNIISDTELTVFAPDSLISNAQIALISSGGCFGISTQTFSLIESDCNTSSEIFISEVYDSDGGSYGVFELYNPTNSVVNLSGIYEIERYGNIGDPTPSNTIPLAGTIDPFDTFIIEMGSTGNSCSGLLPNITLAAGINENDEIRLLKNTVVIDVMYTDDEIGYTFIRNSDAVAPSTTFNISDWTFSETEDCADLRSHTIDAIPDLVDLITQDTCENGGVTFLTSLNNSIFDYQWKMLDASGNWVNVVNDTNHSDPQNSWLDITNIPLSFDGNQYYCEVTYYSSCLLITNAAQIHIENPPVDTLANQNVCTDFTLPTLTNGNYFSASGGNGTPLSAGDVISTTQTIFIYNEIGTAPDACSNESSFIVTVTGTPLVDTLTNQNVCVDFTLPTLTNGNYFSASGGNGTPLSAGDVISTTQTIFIYNEIGSAPDICSNESSFTITVIGTPLVDTLTNQNVCANFTLPTLTNGNYFSASGGNGTPLNAGDVISTTQTIFIYNEVGIAPNNCSNESSFLITVIGTPLVDTLADQDVCTDFTLPTLTNGNYFSASGGNGTPLSAGDVISTTQTIFIYNEVGIAPNNCSNESSFIITISSTPLVDTIANQNVCADFTLPALTNGNYFSASGGNGTPFNAGDVISTTQTIFIYNEVGIAPDTCSNESSFLITVIGIPLVDTLADQDVCTDFTLPTLTNGNYFSASGGTGTPFNTGDVISTTQTIFIYNEVGIAPNNCSNESSFIITVSSIPLVDTIANQNVCTDFTLPALTNGNYFSASGGNGTPFNAGDVISTTQTIYIYNEVGIAPDTCSNESSFTITVIGTPIVDTIANQTACNEFILPTLTNGNYFSASGGTGTTFNAGDIITTSQTIFIYNEVGITPNNCSNESSFTIAIGTSTDFLLNESNIDILNGTLTVNMSDPTLNFEYALTNLNFQTNNIFSNLSVGTYILFVREIGGCITKQIAFEISMDLIIPLYFTPNGDTFKDTWKIIDRNNIVKDVFIFDRYGKLLKHIIGNSVFWDGTFNGKVLGSNDFWYLINLRTGAQLKGHFTLKR